MTSEFYYGTCWKWPIEYVPRFMLSANAIRDRKKPWTITKPWMMDSGIGGMFKGKAREFDINRYLEILDLWQPPIAWSYDFPCEPGIREKFNYSVSQAQERTTENTGYLKDRYENINAVVQGWELKDYLDHIDQIRETGTFTKYLGIGSICRRGQADEIVRIIKAVHQSVPGWVKLHGFGVKISILKTEARFFLHSADSIAWSWDWQQKGKQYRKAGKFYGINSKSEDLLRWIERIESQIAAPDPLYSMELMP